MRGSEATSSTWNPSGTVSVLSISSGVKTVDGGMGRCAGKGRISSANRGGERSEERMKRSESVWVKMDIREGGEGIGGAVGEGEVWRRFVLFLELDESAVGDFL
jgi:hypothetical protein